MSTTTHRYYPLHKPPAGADDWYWHVLAADQGQMVEVAYSTGPVSAAVGAGPGDPWRCITDHSTGEVWYYALIPEGWHWASEQLPEPGQRIIMRGDPIPCGTPVAGPDGGTRCRYRGRHRVNARLILDGVVNAGLIEGSADANYVIWRPDE